MDTIPIELKIHIHSLVDPLDFGRSLLAIKGLAKHYRACPWDAEAYKNRHLIPIVEPTSRGHAKYTTLLGLIHGKHELIVNRLPEDGGFYNHREFVHCNVSYFNNTGSCLFWPVKNNIMIHSSWKHGKKHGLFEVEENDVIINRSYYINGMLHGLNIGWHTDTGKRWVTSHYSNGIANGSSWEWLKNGQLKSHAVYSKNQLKSYKLWYKSLGTKIHRQLSLQLINDGQLTERKMWNIDGRLISVYYMFNNKCHGVCKSWWLNNMEITNYDNGRLHGITIIWKDRKIFSSKFYVYGTEI